MSTDYDRPVFLFLYSVRYVDTFRFGIGATVGGGEGGRKGGIRGSVYWK